MRHSHTWLLFLHFLNQFLGSIVRSLIKQELFKIIWILCIFLMIIGDFLNIRIFGFNHPYHESKRYYNYFHSMLRKR